MLKFSVVEPSGIELQGHKELLELRAKYREAYNPQYHNEFQNYIRRYPTSVYLPVVYNDLTYIYTTNVGFSEQRKKLIDDGVNRFKDSMYAYEFVHVFAHTKYHHRKESKSHETCLAKEVRRKYPQSKIDFYLQAQIKK